MRNRSSCKMVCSSALVKMTLWLSLQRLWRGLWFEVTVTGCWWITSALFMLSPVVHHITTIGCFNYREFGKEGSWILETVIVFEDILCISIYCCVDHSSVSHSFSVHRRIVAAAAVSGGVFRGHALSQREAVSSTCRHALHRGWCSLCQQHSWCSDCACWHLIWPHYWGKLQQRAAGRNHCGEIHLLS